MDDSDFGSPFIWGQCQECRLIFEDWDPLAEPRQPCPDCGSDSGLPWPGVPARPILDKALALRPDDDEDLATMCTLVAVAIETILEWTLQDIFDRFTRSFPLPRRLADYLIEADWSVERRLHMLKTITEVDYAAIAKTVGEREFPGEWKELRERRNRFVHRGDSCTIEPMPELQLVRIGHAALKVFAAVNNAVWSRAFEGDMVRREDLEREIGSAGPGYTADSASASEEAPAGGLDLPALLARLPEKRRAEVLLSYADMLKERAPRRYRRWYLALPNEYKELLDPSEGPSS